MTRFPLEIRPFLGVPYEDRGRTLQGCDCWGLLFLVYAALGVEVPSYRTDYGTAADGEEVARLIQNEVPVWRSVPAGDERPTDGVLLRLGRHQQHVGIVVEPGKMLHTSFGMHGSKVDRYTSPEFKRRVVGFYRHERLSSAI